jgi:hypothetical protein
VSIIQAIVSLRDISNQSRVRISRALPTTL